MFIWLQRKNEKHYISNVKTVRQLLPNCRKKWLLFKSALPGNGTITGVVLIYGKCETKIKTAWKICWLHQLYFNKCWFFGNLKGIVGKVGNAEMGSKGVQIGQNQV